MFTPLNFCVFESPHFQKSRQNAISTANTAFSDFYQIEPSPCQKLQTLKMQNFGGTGRIAAKFVNGDQKKRKSLELCGANLL
jgi:hypothetical protein